MAGLRTVLVSGGFDPLHLGHLYHLQQARGLGDRLVVITHPDDRLVAKKGYCFMPLAMRVRILEALRCVDEVWVNDLDTDGTCAKFLRQSADAQGLDRAIYAKGGDRTQQTMPAAELDACRERGIEVVFGVGAQLGSSSDLAFQAADKLQALGKL